MLYIIIACRLMWSYQAQFVDMSGESGTIKSSFLDTGLWYNATAERLTYNLSQRRFITKDITVLKFKYDGVDEDVQSKDSVSKLLTRRRRNVFGKDNRFHITHRFVEEFPFQTVVRLGNGCTGTLIWYQHVLTAAHCVHDRSTYNPPLKQLYVSLLRTDGTFKKIAAKRVHVPTAWIKKKLLKYLNHDYAVIELNRPHGRRWMPFGVYNIHENQYIQFAGYPSDKKKNQMWYSYCRISQLLKHVFLNYCDATPGMSGSGVYVYNKYDRHDRKVVAVFSSHLQRRKYGEKDLDYAVNVATRLTAKKVRRICKWMNAGHKCYRMNSYFDGRRRIFINRRKDIL